MLIPLLLWLLLRAIEEISGIVEGRKFGLPLHQHGLLLHQTKVGTVTLMCPGICEDPAFLARALNPEPSRHPFASLLLHRGTSARSISVLGAVLTLMKLNRLPFAQNFIPGAADKDDTHHKANARWCLAETHLIYVDCAALRAKGLLDGDRECKQLVTVDV